MDEIDIASRLTRIETLQLEKDKALIIAEEGTKRHFQTVNEFQKRIDKAEATYANKDYVRDQLRILDIKYEAKMDALQKLFYTLAAVAAALELYFRLSK